VSKHDRTLAAIFANPIRANIKWADIESLFRHLGAIVVERSGSRVGVDLNGVVAVFHRPHPSPETKRPTVRQVREFLMTAEVRP
jgi:hypothetical protein